MAIITGTTLALLAALGGGAAINRLGTDVSNSVSKDRALASLKRANADFLKNVSDRELEGYLDAYKSENNDIFNLWGLFGDKYGYDSESMLADLARLSDASANMPTAPNREQMYADAQKQIEDENAEILGMYDADKQRQTELYNNLMSQNNTAYNRNVGQIMSNDYQKNAQLMGTVRSELQRSQRNALESGASAGMRIAENINTTLSLQNRQSQQSLETSNNLAQMLLNQQQANAGLRSEYGNYLSQDADKRASLKSGTAERVENQFANRLNSAESIYDSQMRDYENAYDATVGATNPFANTYKSHLQKSQYSQK